MNNSRFLCSCKKGSTCRLLHGVIVFVSSINCLWTMALVCHGRLFVEEVVLDFVEECKVFEAMTVF